MPTVHDLIVWFASRQGRPLAAASLFVVMYVVKLHPWVEQKLLTTPRRRLYANAFLAASPAVYLLADQSVPAPEVIETAIEACLGAMGIHVGWKVLKGRVLGAPADLEKVLPLLSRMDAAALESLAAALTAPKVEAPAPAGPAPEVLTVANGALEDEDGDDAPDSGGPTGSSGAPVEH